MRSLRIAHRSRRGMEESRFHTYRWRRVYRRATNECAVPPLDIGVWAIQLSPYRVGVAGLCHTRLLTSPAFQPCCCSLALSGLGEAVASESSALNSGLLRRQFAPCVTRRTLSAHPAFQLRLHTAFSHSYFAFRSRQPIAVRPAFECPECLDPFPLWQPFSASLDGRDSVE